MSLVRHIRDKGFSRFAFIGGPNNLVNQIDLLKWFMAARTKCELEIDKNHILSTDMSSTGGYEAASQLLSSSAPPNAICCVNDETAFGALSAACAHGFSIGKELALAGSEGVRDSRYVEPPVTTFDIPVAQIVHQSVQILLERLSNPSLETHEIKIQPEL